MTTRRDARDRVFGTDHFEKVGDTEADDIVNASGMLSPNTIAVRRPDSAAASNASRHLQPRRQITVNAASGARLDEGMRQATMRDVRKAGIRAEVDKAAPGDRPMLDHIFGIDRDREV